MNQIFRQYFDKTSSTYTYLIGDVKNRVAVLIDTVQECVKRELATLSEFKFERVYLLSTHVHADHITGNALIKEQLGCSAQSVISKYYNGVRGDILVGEESELKFGDLKLNFLHTPGHTSGCLCIVDHNNSRVFTGDTLLIRGCGRTDFQGGNASQLYDSVHSKLFTLPAQYAVYPAHDYNGKNVSSIGEEIEFNPRLGKTKADFISLMNNLELAYPKLIDIAVPLNMKCGFNEADE